MHRSYDLVRMMGLEPIRSYEHEHLKLACLPAYSSTRAYGAGRGIRTLRAILAAAFKTVMSTNCIHTRI